MIVVGSIHQYAFVLHFHIGAVEKGKGRFFGFGMEPVHAEGHMEGRLFGGTGQPELERIGCLFQGAAGNREGQMADGLRIRFLRESVGGQRQVDQRFFFDGNGQPALTFVPPFTPGILSYSTASSSSFSVGKDSRKASVSSSRVRVNRVWPPIS